MEDPVMSLIRDLDNPAKFRKKPNVRVFAPHTREFPEVVIGKQVLPARTVKVTEEDLRRIADNCNRVYNDWGQLVLLVDGHRNPNPATPESQQPQELGYARNFRVANMPVPSGKLATVLICDEYHKASCLDKCDQRSGRSAEYVSELQLITGIALLTSDAALHLGFVGHYHRSVCYSMGAMSAMPEPIVQDPPKDLNKPIPYSDDEGQWTNEDEMQYRRYKRYARRYQAENGGAMPNPTEPKKPDQIPAAYGSPTNALLYSMQQQMEQLRRANVEANAARLLDPIVTHVRFDYARELKTLVNCQTDQERAEHVQYILANYEKLPTGGMIPVSYSAPAAPTGSGPRAEPPKYQEILSYMRAHPGMTYEQAQSAVCKQ
jgi:hypothetical protein